MRRFGKSNKIAFAVFAALIVGCVVVLSFVVLKNVGDEPTIIKANAGSYVYTTADDVIVLEAEAKIQKKWDKNFYIIEDRHSSINLGKHPILYDPAERSLTMLGQAYKVEVDGSLVNHKSNLTLTDFNTDALYKLQDRLYVMVGQDIHSHDGTILSKGFMRISLDKMGNALFSSLTTNNKTISPVVLIADEVYFDVSSELLYSNGQEMNLRKVIGSTNEYNQPPLLYASLGIDRPEGSTANTRVPDIEYYTIIAGKGGKGGTGGDGGDGGDGGNGGKGGTGGTGGNGGQGGVGGDGGEAFYSGVYHVDAISVTADAHSITLKYNAVDPYDNIAALEFWVTQGDTTEQYQLNKLLDSYTVYNLDANTEYEVAFYCYEYVQNTETKMMEPSSTPVRVPLSNTTITTNDVKASIKTILMSGDRLVTNLSLYGMQYNDFFINSASTSIVFEISGHEKTESWSNEVEFTLDETAFTENGQTLEFTLSIDEESPVPVEKFVEKVELLGIYQGYDSSTHTGQEVEVPGLEYEFTVQSIKQ